MDKMLLWIILITLVAGAGGTGLGGVVSAVIRKDSTKIVSLLLSFAGGVMLAVVCFDLIPDALFPSTGDLPNALFITIAGIAFGFAVVALLNYAIDKHTNPEMEHIDSSHPKTADDLDELIHSDHLQKHLYEKKNLFTAGLIMACAIALHNLPEGMVIGAAYASNEMAELWSGSGFIMAVILGFHNIPEGMAIAVPLIAGGMGRLRAILVTALCGLPTVVGAVLGYWLGSMGPLMNAIALGFASGAMLYVVFGELLPESILMWRSKLPAVGTMAGIILGLLLIFA